MTAMAWQSFEKLSQTAQLEWPAVRTAREKAQQTIERLQNTQSFPKMPPDTSFVVFGSLARGEETEKSDIDWTLLIDGQADAKHHQFAHSIDATLRTMGLAAPNPGGAFGKLSFSHELVHKVGGEQDSNRNTTQRVLLLLESCSPAGDQVRQRVVKQLFNRYLEDDVTYQSDQKEVRVPRFLLNDVVRFWRTMAVDFPAKQRDRNGKGWALRNFKLRMSRKLIFAAGLMTCLNAHVRRDLLTSSAESADRDAQWALQEYLAAATNRPPLETLAEAILAYAALSNRADTLGPLAATITAYDEFLQVLNDPAKRARLDALDRETARGEALFTDECRAIGNRFQEGLSALFFGSYEPLTSACQRYGVF
jgi:predicted nucleotidyltransferase